MMKMLTRWINKRNVKQRAVVKLQCEHPSNERAAYQLTNNGGISLPSEPDTLVICAKCGEMKLMRLKP